MLVSQEYMRTIPTSSKVLITLLGMNKEFKNIVVVKNSFISIMDQLFSNVPNGEISYYYNGVSLNKSMTFDFYNLKNQDKIIVAFNSDQAKFLNKNIYNPMESSSDAFSNQNLHLAKLIANNELRLESERIQDLRLMKHELKRSNKRFVVKNNATLNDKITNNFEFKIPSVKKISKDPFPCIW